VAASSSYIGKFFFLNCSDGQLYVGTHNFPTDAEMMPCVPQALISPVHDFNSDQQQDAMLLWLEEHGRRLHNGMIKILGKGNIKSISQFPEESPLCSTAVTSGVKVSNCIWACTCSFISGLLFLFSFFLLFSLG
jgi:F-box protein 3